VSASHLQTAFVPANAGVALFFVVCGVVWCGVVWCGVVLCCVFRCAAAAKHYSVPFVVVAGLYKLCPLYAFDQDTFNEHVAPTQILQFEENISDKIEVVNPAYDYIAPELVGLYITNEYGRCCTAPPAATDRTSWCAVAATPRRTYTGCFPSITTRRTTDSSTLHE
jgi:hypothetical protein